MLPPHRPVKYGFDPSNPPEVPTELTAGEGSFYPSFDNRLFMFYRIWEPPRNQPIRATLLIIHGTVDHSGVYRQLGRELSGAGVAVIAMDMRGWGLSDGESMYFHDVDTFVKDVKFLSDKIHRIPRFENVKSRFLLGKSLGGLVTAYAVARYPNEWKGLIGLSGGYQVEKDNIPAPVVVSIVNLLGWLAPKMFLKKAFDERLIVSDEAALEEWREDELCCKDKIRVGYGIEFMRCVDELETSIAAELSLPMLMMIGDEDRVVTLSGHEMMIRNNKSADKELKVYPGGFHNLLQEPELNKMVKEDIQEWILNHS